MPIERDGSKWLRRKSRRDAVAFPVGTVAFYGPDNTRASKIAASVILEEHGEATNLRRWFDDVGDLRKNRRAMDEVVTFFKTHGVRRVAMIDGIIGCPHEEGVDYEGETCPACPFWAGRDRWTGKLLE